MKPVVFPEQMASFDARTISQCGIPGMVLMERAALAVADAVGEAKSVLVMCGAGNNGGDGYAVARILHTRGIPCACFAVAVDKLCGDAMAQYRAAQAFGVCVHSDMAMWPQLLAGADTVVDALFGTGLSGDLASPYSEMVQQLNRANKTVVAVDIPSGIHGGTGQVMGHGVRACVTVCFEYVKAGLCLYPGREYAGRVQVADIGIPPLWNDEINLWQLEAEDICTRRRVPQSHKYHYGHVGVAAGSRGMLGAGALCAQAAMVAGAGLVSWVMPECAADTAAGFAREIMTCPWPCDDGQLAAGGDIQALLRGKAALAVGPGLGRKNTESFLGELAPAIDCPVVFDADALYAFAQEPALLECVRAPKVITPHAGELARMMGCEAEQVESAPIYMARSCADKTGAVVVLKGATTVVAAPGGPTALSLFGNPGMATAGSGDVLCGCVAAFLAQGADAYSAACSACVLHGTAGDWAAEKVGMISMVAGDILRGIPKVLASL